VRAQLIFRAMLLMVAEMAFGPPPPRPDVYLAAAAAGTNDGSSCANAHAAGFFNTVGNWGTGTTQIGSGSTVHLCGTIPITLTAPTSQGTGLITIKFEPGAMMQQPAATVFISITRKTNAYLITGQSPCGWQNRAFVACTEKIQNTANGSPDNFPNHVAGVHGIDFSNSTGGLTIKNLEISRLYVHDDPNDSVNPDGAHLANAVVADVMMSNVTITDGDFHDTSWAIPLNPRQTSPHPVLTIAHMDLSHNDHDIALGSTCNPACYSVVIHDVHSHDHTNWNTVSNAYHHDGFHFFNSQFQASSVVMYNILWDGPWTGNDTGPIFNQVAVQNLSAFNLIFICDSGCTNDPIALWQYGGGPNQLLANNTFIQTGLPRGSGPHFTNGGDVLMTNPTAYTGNVSTLNNIVANGTTLWDEKSVTYAANTARSGRDYNLYANYITNGSTAFNYKGTHTNVFATWQSLSGEGAHSQMTASAILGSDGRPQAGSPAISVGTNLTALCVGALVPLCKDYEGVDRPTTGPWTVGALNAGKPIGVSGTAKISGNPTIRVNP
jgi:hypothetical protein